MKRHESPVSSAAAASVIAMLAFAVWSGLAEFSAQFSGAAALLGT
ncbi:MULTISPECIES: hypothetical protein [Novosphingobium]|uniref:Uncharacterized protein n=1 Tax=Novosphingobium mathurense TaxID=428990 RepID=A0A1U6IF56_9SPHN|nr:MULTISPECIES: hypothetical protein [Novosphingobium]CDO37157.1 exported hypothetical protein [Novosphingobium sp. KN65.2]SLK06637.1 hypothetical protein SAMN06295987_10629 [Novosphingobium mathurense]